jgi:hypothetical protein
MEEGLLEGLHYFFVTRKILYKYIKIRTRCSEAGHSYAAVRGTLHYLEIVIPRAHSEDSRGKKSILASGTRLVLNYLSLVLHTPLSSWSLPGLKFERRLNI